MRVVVTLGILTSMVACAPSGSQRDMAVPPPPEMRFSAPEPSALLYAGGPNANDVDVYGARKNNPQPKRHITDGLDAPTGIAVDNTENVYVCNNAGQSAHGKSVFWTVTVYRPHRSRPVRVYTNGVFSPVDVTVDNNGTVYVANFSSTVTVYPAGSLNPSRSLHGPAGYAPIGVAVDGRTDNVFVSYDAKSGSGGLIYRYHSGKSRGRDLGITFSGSPHGLAIDHAGNLIVAVSNAPSSGSEIEIFAPGAKQPKQILMGPFQPFMLALSPDNRRLYAADYGTGNNDGGVFVYKYPAGTLLFKDTNGAAAGAYGLAVDPPAL